VSPGDLFFDLAGPRESWPGDYPLAVAVRFAVLAGLVLGPYFLRYGRGFTRRPKVEVAAILTILASLLIGLDYLVFQAPATISRAAGSGALSIHMYYSLTAGTVFLICQAAGVIELSNGEPGFIRWIVPPVIYLLVIGVVASAMFGNGPQLVVDSVRAAVLLGFSVPSFTRLRRRAP